MWYFLYNVLLLLASPVIVLVLLAKKRCRRGLRQRLGLLPHAFLRRVEAGPRRILWVHAVSLGEAVAAVPLVRELHRRYPDYRLVVSTVTETGREAVEQRLEGIAAHCYAPLDFPWVVSKVVRCLNPAMFVFVETELWPNLLRTLARRGVPAVLVNGRLSSRSFRRYRIIRPLLRRMLAAVTLCLMQSERDAGRIVELGAPSDRVFRTGNIKFDQPLPDEKIGPGSLTRRTIVVAEQEHLIVAGSTHAGEEEQLLACYQHLQREVPSLVLLLAPRHIERAADVEAAVRARGLGAVRRSTLDLEQAPAQPRIPRVIILDTRGELALVYRHAALSFVGGTLVPVGGHNLLEPAVWGKPVFFGPYTDHCAEVAELLLKAGGGRRVRNGEELAGAMAGLLREPSALRTMGAAARHVVMENQGALERSLKHIGGILEIAGSAEGRPVRVRTPRPWA